MCKPVRKHQVDLQMGNFTGRISSGLAAQGVWPQGRIKEGKEHRKACPHPVIFSDSTTRYLAILSPRVSHGHGRAQRKGTYKPPNNPSICSFCLKSYEQKDCVSSLCREKMECIFLWEGNTLLWLIFSLSTPDLIYSYLSGVGEAREQGGGPGPDSGEWSLDRKGCNICLDDTLWLTKHSCIHSIFREAWRDGHHHPHFTRRI